MKQLTQKSLIVPIIRKVAAQISPTLNEKASDEDYYSAFNHITKYIRTLKLDVIEYTIIEGTIRMTTFSNLSDYGHDYAVNDIEEWLLNNSIYVNTGKGLAN